MGLTMVLTWLARRSGGVGSSMLPDTSADCYLSNGGNLCNLHPSHVLVVAHKTSVLFSRWLTIVRKAIDMMVSGGVSFGAAASVSGMGLTFLGVATENSILHHDACDC